MMKELSRPDWFPESEPNGPYVWWDSLTPDQQQIASKFAVEIAESEYKRSLAKSTESS